MGNCSCCTDPCNECLITHNESSLYGKWKERRRRNRMEEDLRKFQDSLRRSGIIT